MSTKVKPITEEELEQERLLVKKKFNEAVAEGMETVGGAKEMRAEFAKFIESERNKVPGLREEADKEETEEGKAEKHRAIDLFIGALDKMAGALKIEESIAEFKKIVEENPVDVDKFDNPNTLHKSNGQYNTIISRVCGKRLNPSFVKDGKEVRIDVTGYASIMAVIRAHGIIPGYKINDDKIKLAEIIAQSFETTKYHTNLYNQILDMSIVAYMEEKGHSYGDIFPLRYIKQIIIENAVRTFESTENEDDRIRFASSFMLGTCKSFKDEWFVVLDKVLEIYKDQLTEKKK